MKKHTIAGLTDEWVELAKTLPDSEVGDL